MLIVDDEPLAHDVLAHLCEREGDIEIVAHCLNASEALTQLEKQTVDLMLLDIRMPVFGGLDLLRGVHNPPLTIIVSAHQEHAYEGFELDVIDYLLKPVSSARFAEAIAKVRRRRILTNPDACEEPKEIVLKVDRAMRRFRFDDITCVHARGNYVAVCAGDQTLLATITMKELLSQLPARHFIRVHRSCIVNRQRIVEQRASQVLLDDGQVVPIGRSYRKAGKNSFARPAT
ncbi:LytR/AlgR family response regulator transcription factor [Porphyrobacter sp. CACIAM 03H1]|uniref:LytR/AlgR family response regulator transcription factor n=1 Tax=Porphyrobacter sp. CACIAM 03H1 TaxID=2003315 RepID=UPI001F4434E8|nr:LytTR family DNA-binding domain-containing protein [Porphyrobacter sp. CACIAM 03H1]